MSSVIKSAGRELDAQIAERVMGWTLDSPVDPTCDHAVGTNRDGSSARRNFYRNQSGVVGVTPLFSTEIAAAFTVVEAMRAKGWAVDVMSHRGTPTGWSARCWLRRGVWFDTDAETPALAICRAALAAIEAAATTSAVAPPPSLPPRNLTND